MFDKLAYFKYNNHMEKFENITAVIAENLVYYRKKAQLTQSELASKLNYSDKSISKWERGEGVPDIHVIVQLAKLYGLTVNDFVTTRKKERIANRYYSKVLITLISVALVWFVATIAFFCLRLFALESQDFFPHWLVFIYAIPISFIVLVVFVEIYFKKIFNMFMVSGLCWSIALSLHLSFAQFQSIGLVYIVAIPFQILIILFFLLMNKKRKEKIYD